MTIKTKLELSTSEETLKNFMEEFFYFDGLLEAGMFTEEMRNDYQAQADKICYFFGYKTVFEYGSEEIRCHISFGEEEKLLHVNEKGELMAKPFVTVIPNIYE